MDLGPVHAYVDARCDHFVEQLRRLIRQPSVASQGRGMRECAALVRELMSAAGIEARIVESDGQPVVLGELRSAQGAQVPTLLLYTHYDVQSEDPVDEWSHPPFEAAVVDGCIIGRGASDAKGNLVCHLAAAESYLRAAGGPPLNLKFVFDGEEEIGSPSLPSFLASHRAELGCDCVLALDGGADPSDRPRIMLGTSGLLYLQLRCTGSTKDLHSARARLAPNPAWRLLWALATMKGPDERITIEGFYDDVRPPDDDERRLIQAFRWDEAAQRRHYGVERFVTGVTGSAALERLLFQPTCNICGFRAGSAGGATKTVIPHVAMVDLDFRLVCDQDPDDILAKVRAHLGRHGFDDIEVQPRSRVEPSRSPTRSPVSQAAIEAARETYGVEPAVAPRSEASGRTGNWLAARLGVPGASSGIGPPDWHGHVPNEFMTLSHFRRGIHYEVNIWRRVAERCRQG